MIDRTERVAGALLNSHNTIPVIQPIIMNYGVWIKYRVNRKHALNSSRIHEQHLLPGNTNIHHFLVSVQTVSLSCIHS